MNKNKNVTVIFPLAAVLTLFMLSCKSPNTEVTVCGTLHGYHKKNPNYSYDQLFSFIEKYNPDIIGLEIRPEDMDEDHAFLQNYYPREMTEVVKRFAGKELVGIDWWNKSVEGEKVSDELIDTLFNVVMARKYSKDTLFLNRKPAIIDELNNQKMQIAATASMCEVINGNYDSLNICFYNELGRYFEASPYQKLYESYMVRHQKLADNMVEVVRENPGKRILFLTGVDHQAYARRKMEKVFGDEIRLNLFCK